MFQKYDYITNVLFCQKKFHYWKFPPRIFLEKKNVSFFFPTCQFAWIPLNNNGIDILSPLLFGILFWRKFRENLQCGRSYIFQKVVDWHCLKAHYRVFLPIIYHISPFLLMWLTRLRRCKGTFFASSQMDNWYALQKEWNLYHINGSF